MAYDPKEYYIDFSSRAGMPDDTKLALERIQNTYLPLERLTFLYDYKFREEITDDDWEIMTGIPFTFQ